MKKLWVVAALCVAAANSVQATEIEVVWDGEVQRVEVDGAYTSVHPQQKGLQAVIAGDIRPAVRNLEDRVSNHETRIVALENTPRIAGEDSGASALERRVQKMDPAMVSMFWLGGLIGGGILVCFIILLCQQGGGQQALGTALAMLNQVGNRLRIRVTVTTRAGDTVSLAADGEPVAQQPALPQPPAPVPPPAPPAAPAVAAPAAPAPAPAPAPTRGRRRAAAAGTP